MRVAVSLSSLQVVLAACFHGKHSSQILVASRLSLHRRQSGMSISTHMGICCRVQLSRHRTILTPAFLKVTASYRLSGYLQQGCLPSALQHRCLSLPFCSLTIFLPVLSEGLQPTCYRLKKSGCTGMFTNPLLVTLVTSCFLASNLVAFSTLLPPKQKNAPKKQKQKVFLNVFPA